MPMATVKRAFNVEHGTSSEQKWNMVETLANTGFAPSFYTLCSNVLILL